MFPAWHDASNKVPNSFNKLRAAPLARRRYPPCRLLMNQSGGTMRLAVNLKTILLAIAVVVVSFLVRLKTMDWLLPRGAVVAPLLLELPPLPPAPRSSSIIAPVA